MRLILGLILGALLATQLDTEHQVLMSQWLDKLGLPAHETVVTDVPATSTDVVPVEVVAAPEPPAPEPLEVIELFPEETTPAEEDILEITEVIPEPEPVPEVSVPAVEPTFQTAWMPFRSEKSASGFADKLSRQLARDFHVVRLGPGKYQVGFTFVSFDDRDEVLRTIENITGFHVPASS